VRWDNAEDGRLRAFVGPSGIHWCSPRLLESCLALAEQYQTGMHLHAVETELQAAVIHETLGTGGIRYLEAMHLLHEGTSLAHTIWMDEGDLDILARTGATVVHNPVSNLRLGSGRFPFPAALQHGVAVALGSDGSASNDNQNMFSVLKLVGLMHNQPDVDYMTWPQATQILHAATQGGAHALGLPHALGKVEPGQLADLVMLDLETDAFLPLRDPYLHLVYCERGASVDTVIVNGTIVVENSRLCTIDEQEIRREIRERCHFNWSCFNEGLDNVATMQEVLTKLGKLRSRILQKSFTASSF
jgi:5-methylthioadenosine/S-adenosylhomocysteine deaminase